MEAVVVARQNQIALNGFQGFISVLLELVFVDHAI